MNENGRSGEGGARLRVMLCHEVPVMRGGLRAIIDAESDMAPERPLVECWRSSARIAHVFT